MCDYTAPVVTLLSSCRIVSDEGFDWEFELLCVAIGSWCLVGYTECQWRASLYLTWWWRGFASPWWHNTLVSTIQPNATMEAHLLQHTTISITICNKKGPFYNLAWFVSCKSVCLDLVACRGSRCCPDLMACLFCCRHLMNDAGYKWGPRFA